MKKIIAIVCFLMIFGFSNAFASRLTTTTPYNSACEEFAIIIDNSGSMKMANKMENAKLATTLVLNAVPNEIYKSTLDLASADQTLIPLCKFDRVVFIDRIQQIKSDGPIYGHLTSLGDSLIKKHPVFPFNEKQKALILVTDGKINKGVSLVDACSELYKSDPNLVIHFISLADTPKGKQAIKESAALNGHSYVARAEDLIGNDVNVERFILNVFYNKIGMIEIPVANFEFNKSDVTWPSQFYANEAARIIKASDGRTANIEASACICGGKSNYNQKLSERRADEVKSYLNAQNISSDQMTTKGRGATNYWGLPNSKEGSNSHYLNREAYILLK